MLARVIHFPMAHWRGQVSVLPNLALTLLGLRFVIAANGGLPLLSLDITVLVWQIVGSWRALARHQRSTPDFLISVFGYGSILICIPVFLAPQLDRVTANQVPQASLQDDTPTGVRVEPNYILLSGPINFGMFDALKAAIEQHSNTKAIHLASDGGRVFAARAIARLVRENSLQTHVDGTCASACTLIFVASPSRSLGATGRLGFHGYSNVSQVQLVDIAEEEATDRASFTMMGIADSFVDKAFLTPPSDIWFPSQQELSDAGVVTLPFIER
ncbi:hypothetical protein SAMN05444000_104175 [Shimia gijangensis]|uniref:Uncharacterized protein n=1 Tax=Shimia gijangensis TaxID=1470563 RepID=A0A1M6FVD4_9RHOB|nr:hypothetical protein [Shimia gijangensis]SHJ01644.1 hypothetical protein SAMN05444000_104175 [Shimia gijangensis]